MRVVVRRLLLTMVLTIMLGTVGYLYIALRRLDPFKKIVQAPSDDFQERLIVFEKNWKRQTDVLVTAETDAEDGKGKKYPFISGSGPVEGSVPWSYFQPNFLCPLAVERVGKEGDGGKYVCGLAEMGRLTSCTVYSFGVNDEVSFETEVLERTNCKVRMFDTTMMNTTLLEELTKRWLGRALYYHRGIGPLQNSLKAIMEHFNDTFVDLLKMDAEGAEWVGLEEAANDFPDGFPAGQLQVELHRNTNWKPQYKPIRKLFNMLQKVGLRPFFREMNPYHNELFEYSFLNIKFGMFKINKPLSVPF